MSGKSKTSVGSTNGKNVVITQETRYNTPSGGSWTNTSTASAGMGQKPQYTSHSQFNQSFDHGRGNFFVSHTAQSGSKPSVAAGINYTVPLPYKRS